jgi:hypothetical protein
MSVSSGRVGTDITGGPRWDSWDNLLPCRGGSAYFDRVDKGFPWLAQKEAILPCLCSGLRNHPVHVSAFCGQDLCVLDLDAMSRLMLCSATADLSGWARRMYRWCYLSWCQWNGQSAQSKLDDIRRVFCTRLEFSVPGRPSGTERNW